MTVKEFLAQERLFSTSILAVLYSEYGSEFIDWDPVSIELQIKDDFGIELPSKVSDRLHAGVSIISTNLFHIDVETFNTVCNVLSFNTFSTKQFIPAEVDECAWGCTEARLLEGDLYKAGFSEDIQKYVGVLLKTEGIYRPPSVLNFAEYPEDIEESARNELIDDDVMFKAFWDRQEEKIQEIEKSISTKLSELLMQLKQLPVKKNNAFIENALNKLQG